MSPKEKRKSQIKIHAKLLLFLMFMGLFGFLGKTRAAAEDYTITNGDPGSLPTVGAASVSIGTVTLTDPDTGGGGDDIGGDPEILTIAINTTDYPNVVFDQTVTSFTVGGLCGYTGHNAVTYTDAQTIQIPVTGGIECTSNGHDVTVAGLRVQTIFEQAAPGAAPLISVDNTTTNPGNPIDSSTNVNYASAAADAAATVTLANGTVGATQNTTLALTLPVDLEINDTVVFTMPNNINVSSVAFSSDSFAGAGAFTCTDAGQIVTCTATGAITAGTGNIVMSGVTGAYAASGQTMTSLAVNDVSNGGGDIAVDASGTVTDTTVADAAASVTLGTNSVVGVAGDTTLTLTTPFALDADDTIDITFPAHIDVSGVGAAVTGTFEGASNITCAAVAQTVTCTTDGATNATGAIIMTGILSASAGTADVTSVEVEDEGVGANDIAIDTTVTLTDSTLADAAASITLGTNSVVGTAGNTILNITIPAGLVSPDTVNFDAPANLDVSGVTFSSHDLGGGGAFVCAAVGQTVTCTAGGPINAGSGGITMTGIDSLYAASGQTVTNVAVFDDTAAANIATDASGTVTDTTAADATASAVLASPTVGATGDTTLTLTTPFALDADDTIDITFPAHIDVSGVGAAVTGTFEGGANITCAAGGQVVTCTTDGATNATGTVIMTGITAAWEGTADITSVEVEDEGVGANDIATDGTVSLTDSTPADAAASLTLADPNVGATQNTTLAITIPVDMANTDTITFDAPTNLDVSSVAFSSDTFAGAGAFACADAGQAITCTANGVIAAGTGNIVMSGISPLYGATAQTITNVAITDTSAGADTATDASGTVTDTIAEDADATVTLGANAAAGVAGDTTLDINLSSPLDADDTIDITFPAHFDVSGVGAAVTGTFEASDSITCAAVAQVVTCTTSAATNATGTIIMTGILTLWGSTTDVTSVEVEDEGVASADLATDTTVATTDSTGGSLTASVTLGTNSAVNVAGNTTLTLTIPAPLSATDTIDITFPAHMDVSGVGAATTGTLAGASNITCAAAGQVVTCTTDGATNATGTVIMTGILSASANTANISSLEVEVGGVDDNDMATSNAVPLTDSIAGAITGASIELSDYFTSRSVTATADFTTPNTIPNNGKIKITFGAGFNLSTVGAASGTCPTMDGTFVTSKAGQVVTITRSGGTDQTADAESCTISNVITPSSAGVTGAYSVQTTNSTNSILAENLNVDEHIINASPVSPPAPSGGGGGGGGLPVPSSSSSSKTSFVPTTVPTSTGEQSYSGPIQFEMKSMKVSADEKTVVIQVTDKDGTLDLRTTPNSKLNMSVPAGTTLTAPASWKGGMKPPVFVPSSNVSTEGDLIEGSSETLKRKNLIAILKTGSDVKLEFSKKVTLNIPLDLDDGTLVNIYESDDTEKWRSHSSKIVDKGMITIETSKLNYFAFTKAEGQLHGSAHSFRDIYGHWAREYIEKLTGLGIAKGRNEENFAPDENVSRAEITKMALNAFGHAVPDKVEESVFGDVSKDAWYATYITIAQKSGIVSGYGDGSFRPNSTVTRAEAMKIIFEAAGTTVEEKIEECLSEHLLPSWTYVLLPDVLRKEWYAKYVCYAKVNGIAEGYSDNSFKPDNTITRAEVAKVIGVMLEQ